MYINRHIDNELLKWKKEKDHKPILLRGARQIGKSSSVRKLAENFEYFLEVNFEKNSKVHNYFENDFDVREICDQISVQYKIPIIPNKTLLFFDEIQACPKAISALRFFYEDYPELHVIAAGSLLEFALEELPSFGVGRICPMYMYPFSFQEFMHACGEELLWEKVCESSPEKPLFTTFHDSCVTLLKKFLVLGGMPAVVSKYIETKDTLVAQKELSNLIHTLKSDFSKYKKRAPELRILTVFESIVNQSGGKFNYAKVESLHFRQAKESLELLKKAGLVIPVVSTSANGIPLGAEANFRKQKMILLDTGIFQRLLGLEIADLMLSNNLDVINKGSIAEMFVGLELLKASSCYMPDELYFWTRENPQSQAEIDYLMQEKGKIIPIEVKSGTSGKMQSMYLFLKEKQAEYGIRTSLENFATYDKINVYPLYAIGNLTKNTNFAN
jgi:predicted AAA+ superfamily ATPase